MGHGFQWRGLGKSLALTLKNMDREGTRVEAGKQMKRPLDGAVQVNSDGDLECRGGLGRD